MNSPHGVRTGHPWLSKREASYLTGRDCRSEPDLGESVRECRRDEPLLQSIVSRIPEMAMFWNLLSGKRATVPALGFAAAQSWFQARWCMSAESNKVFS